MRKSRRRANSRSASRDTGAGPALQLVRGSVPREYVREALVRRARSRVAAGYYERAGVRKRLVDCLWAEFFAR